MFPFHDHNLHPKGLIFGMGDHHVSHCVLHISDIRISDFGFFSDFCPLRPQYWPYCFEIWYVTSWGLNIDFLLSGFLEIRFQFFGLLEVFRIFPLVSHNIDLNPTFFYMFRIFIDWPRTGPLPTPEGRAGREVKFKIVLLILLAII